MAWEAKQPLVIEQIEVAPPKAHEVSYSFPRPLFKQIIFHACDILKRQCTEHQILKFLIIRNTMNFLLDILIASASLTSFNCILSIAGLATFCETKNFIS